MSFGLKISFGRFCKTLKISGLSFPIIEASGKFYNAYEMIEHDEKKWYITPDGNWHNEIKIETEHSFFYLSNEGLWGTANKKALAKLFTPK